MPSRRSPRKPPRGTIPRSLDAMELGAPPSAKDVRPPGRPGPVGPAQSLLTTQELVALRNPPLSFAVGTHPPGSGDGATEFGRASTTQLVTAKGLSMTVGIVADGLTRHKQSAVAAEIIVRALFEHLSKEDGKDVPRMLEAALGEANRRAMEPGAADGSTSPHGSTAAVAAVVGGRLYLANVGNSRVYLIRGDQWSRLTMDHTWGNEKVRSGKLTEGEAARHPRKDEVVRSVGSSANLHVDLGVWMQGGSETEIQAQGNQGLRLFPGDVVLLCSSALVREKSGSQGRRVVAESELPSLLRVKSASLAAEALLSRARSKHVDGEVSLVVLQVSRGAGLPLAVPTKALPYVGAGVGLLALLAASVLLLGRIFNSEATGPTPTIPALPAGTAYVAEFDGKVELQLPGEGFRPIRPAEMIPAAPGVFIRTGDRGAYVKLALADGTIVYVGPQSNVQLSAIAGASETSETELGLERGVVLVATGAQGGRTMVVSPMGAYAGVRGSIMGVLLDEMLGEFHLDCFQPICELKGPGSGSEPIPLGAGQHYWLDLASRLGGPGATRNHLYSFADYCGGLVATPTPEGFSGGLTGASTATWTPGGPLFQPPTAVGRSSTPDFAFPSATTLPPGAPTPTPPGAPTPPPPPPPTSPPEATITPRPTKPPPDPPTETPTEPPTDTPEPTPTDYYEPPPTDVMPPV